MFDIHYPGNRTSIDELISSIYKKGNQQIFWIGSGCSKWTGYPLWTELALDLIDVFSDESSFQRNKGLQFYKTNDFPALFLYCKQINKNKYKELLYSKLEVKEPSPVYIRFINALKGIDPLWIITTNVDEMLESKLSQINVIQKPDIERCTILKGQSKSFLYKLHGSISNFETIVFSEDDYQKHYKNVSVIENLKLIFQNSSIIFIGTLLQEEYVLNLLKEANHDEAIFGHGLHFAVLPELNNKLPKNTKTIKYVPNPHKDHRTSIQVIEEINTLNKNTTANQKPFICPNYNQNIISAHLLADLFPPGTYNTSETVDLLDPEQNNSRYRVEDGFTSDEIPISDSTAMHDFLVGLIGFDTTYMSIKVGSKLHNIIGSKYFWLLVDLGCIHFIHWDSMLGIQYTEDNYFNRGNIEFSMHLNPDGSEVTVLDSIKRFLKATPGNEKIAEMQFEKMKKRTIIVKSTEEPSFSDITGGLLLRPSIRKCVGFSGGSNFNSIPIWMHSPVLRIANILKIGYMCNKLNIPSIKLYFGCERLAAPIFAALSGKFYADDVVSYIITGRFNTDISDYFFSDKTKLLKILEFRDTQEGINIRKSILDNLSYNAGGDFFASINSAMLSAIPINVIQSARDTFSALLNSNGEKASSVIPTVWTDTRYEKNALNLWKKKSYRIFEKLRLDNKIGLYDNCPCGSGEKVKFCCYEALK